MRLGLHSEKERREFAGVKAPEHEGKTKSSLERRDTELKPKQSCKLIVLAEPESPKSSLSKLFEATELREQEHETAEGATRATNSLCFVTVLCSWRSWSHTGL
jgi:hypothetical protein